MKNLITAFSVLTMVNTLSAKKMLEIPLEKRQVNRQRSIRKRTLVQDVTDDFESVPKSTLDDYLEFELGNFKNTQYYGSLFVGSSQDEFEFIFDTGSPWLWISTDECLNCHTDDLWSTSSSETFER